MAGESVFLPAFHLGRYFKTSLMATYEINNVQLGQLYAIYGMFAMGCYFLGGPLADRWSPRKLLSFSLVITAAGSCYMAILPSFFGLCVLYGFWGVSTILVFWAPLIRATRELAHEDEQGAAFGILDGGRGLASALIATVMAYAFSIMVGGDAEKNPVEATAAVQKLVYVYGINCLLAAVCVWFFVPDSKSVVSAHKKEERRPFTDLLRNLLQVLRSPAIWLQAVVIITAYCAFKMIDNYGIYSEAAYGLSPVESAKLMAYVSYVRVFAAVGAGWIADKLLGVRFTIQICFGLLIGAYLSFLLATPSSSMLWLLVTNLFVSCLGFFALRGVYFALLEESGTPRELTGTAVGVISFIGYTPDIFMAPLTGWLIDEAEKSGDVLVGFQQCFTFLLVMAICGMIAAFALRWFKG